ncbi:hypothetical protein K438DRAFT_1978254 [Mycena galopus ATCC 62051]|nr:hypothetical protein K438DRAFT_1978254 [Mycena galopus ATCC 62051]
MSAKLDIKKMYVSTGDLHLMIYFPVLLLSSFIRTFLTLALLGSLTIQLRPRALYY